MKISHFIFVFAAERQSAKISKIALIWYQFGFIIQIMFVLRCHRVYW